MSEENVEIVRMSLDAWNGGDDAMKAFVGEQYAPDVMLYPLKDFADSQIRHGRDECFLLWTELKEAWESTELEAEGLVDAGDHVVAGILSHGVMRGTEDELEMRLGMTFAFREGQITELRFYRSFAEALEAAGLRE
jgi:ketosteroid isomerase-like protein